MTEQKIIKKIHHAEAVAARHPEGSCYHTGAVHRARKYRRMLACLRAGDRLVNWPDYEPADIN